MAAHAGPGIERTEAKWLGGRTPDRIPQIYAKLTAEDSHLVDQSDVDVAIGVLQQLGHFRFTGGFGLDHLIADLAVELNGDLGALSGITANHLRRVAQTVGTVSGVDTLGREGQVEIDARRQPG